MPNVHGIMSPIYRILAGYDQLHRAVREHWSVCNRSAPSQAATMDACRDPVASPFNPVRLNIHRLFYYDGCHNCVAGDRLSGWGNIFKAPHGTAQAGAQGLIAAHRALFATFGVPEEISSDGGPEFSSAAIADFLTRWEVSHRMSSVCFHHGGPIATYHQHRWYLAGPFAMPFPSSADASSTTTHRSVRHGARHGPKRRTLCEIGCRALQKPYTCIRDHLHLYRLATKYSCKPKVVHTLRNGTNRVPLWIWATKTNTV